MSCRLKNTLGSVISSFLEGSPCDIDIAADAKAFINHLDELVFLKKRWSHRRVSIVFCWLSCFEYSEKIQIFDNDEHDNQHSERNHVNR